ncbi:hypothetical protein INR49_024659, partial [Caranx melampygus]
VWQWIHHQIQLEDDSRVVSRRLVTELIEEMMDELSSPCSSVRAKQILHTAADVFLEVVLKRDFPEFITTYMNQEHTFLSYQATAQLQVLNTHKFHPKL